MGAMRVRVLAVAIVLVVVRANVAAATDAIGTGVVAPGSRPESSCVRYLPPNVELPDSLVPVAEEMIRQSPTFRAQCRRIAAAPNLHLVIRVDLFMQSHRWLAVSVISRWADAMTARITLARQPRYTEILAHELEHILEQVEGLDLRMLSRKRHSGVHESLPGMFETKRAQEAGLRVAREAAGQKIIDQSPRAD